ncbi:MAG: 5-(carboxyamino)imidazole ribonucleotide synthase [Rhodospirillales bacterium]
MTAEPLAPNAVIGVMGGGQLGRMTALAAAPLGYRCHIFTPEAESPAAQVSAAVTEAAYDDTAALDAFAAACDVVTFEFENVPHESVRRLADRVPVRPDWEALRVSQDRAVEKTFINNLGLATAPWAPVSDRKGLDAAWAQIGAPAVLKTARLGYDGKGQTMLAAADADLDAAWEAIGGQPAVLEGFVDLACEVSAVVARSVAGETQCFPIGENRHENHVLAETIVPARIDAKTAEAARGAAARIAEGLRLIGLLAVEFFVTREGGLLVNEIAPRPHNSGHWTQDACNVSQFEQFVRAVAGLPLVAPRQTFAVRMTNILGAETALWRAAAAEPGAHVHLYGKAEARPGRKMGHINRISPLES